jgi:hypothetical protein
MKTTVLALCFLCALAAFGQSAANGVYGSLSSQPVVIEFPSHVEHASPQPMAPQQSLLISSAYIHARGERPLWEVAPATYSLPLGDAARLLRKEHAAAKKAKIIWEN